MQREEDDADSLILAMPSSSPQLERPVVWKQQPRPSPSVQALTLGGAHVDPTTTTQGGKSFFGRIRVVIRCRPLQRDLEGDHTDYRIQTHGDEVIVFEKNSLNTGRSYHFDRVLSSDADQATTFAEVAPLVDHVLDGFHATVFAYGQTGSGKTYTMDGLRYVASSGGGRSKGAPAAMVPDPEGTPVEQHGIMPRMIQLLFDRARARQRAGGEEGRGEGKDDLEDGNVEVHRNGDDGVEYTFRCSYYQIYNETITDLLRRTGNSPNPNGNDEAWGETEKRYGGTKVKRRFDEGGLRVRWQKGDTFKVENLFVCSCASPDEMRQMLFTGTQQKVVSSHMMNYQSSRSHCVFTIYVECRSRKNGELRSRAELSLVDLAGSEKICLLSNNPSAKLVKESIDINTSLLALGKVIMALSSNSGSTGTKSKRRTGGAAFYAASRPRGCGNATSSAGMAHVPYRDSKLTMLLKHALGGNSLTTMIACISPSDRYVEETTSTLLYAGRAKNICNAPHINEDATTTLIRKLREEIAQLKVELGYYREMAAKSLEQPQEAEAHFCSCCGGELQTARTNCAEAPHTSETMEKAVTAREADQLADSLIAACGMLKNMMQVNAELRDAYDAVRDAQDDAERREADLNAENLALRERLAVLESIVLQDNGEDDDEGNAEEDNGRASKDFTVGISAQEGCEVARQEAPRTDGDDNREKAASVSSQSAASSPPQPIQSSSLRSLEMLVESSGLPPRSLKESVNVYPVGPSISKEMLPPVVSAESTAGSTVEMVQLVSPLNRTRKPSRSASPSAPSVKNDVSQPKTMKQRQKKKSYNKKYRVLAQRLKEYEQLYRSSSKRETYEDYYQQPREKRAVAARAVKTVNGMPPIRASSPEQAQSTVTLEDMKVTVAKLPKSLVPEYVPVSLLRPGLFGSLAFGGRQEERADFEQHRSDRAARLRALQKRQQELYRQVHQAVCSAKLGRESPQPPPQITEGDVGISRSTSTHRGVSGSESVSKRGFNAEVGGRRSSSEPPALVGSTATRVPVTDHQSSRGEKSGGGISKRSTNSMTKLMEYLDKNEL